MGEGGVWKKRWEGRVRIQVEFFVAAKRQPGRFPCPYLWPYIPLPTLVMPSQPSPELEGRTRV